MCRREIGIHFLPHKIRSNDRSLCERYAEERGNLKLEGRCQEAGIDSKRTKNDWLLVSPPPSVPCVRAVCKFRAFFLQRGRTRESESERSVNFMGENNETPFNYRLGSARPRASFVCLSLGPSMHHSTFYSLPKKWPPPPTHF